jgi:CPA2 family monovalent cation:H+ antiporter-2
MRYPLRVALAVSVALAQIGEFSFILAALGRQLGILPEAATNALVAAAIVSISLNPLLYRLTDVLEARAKQSPRLWRWLNARLRANLPEPASGADREPGPNGEAVVVGYGPVGRTLVRLLQESGIEPTGIELKRPASLPEGRAVPPPGADAVFAGEGEVALSMTEFILRQLGASGEQIDRERDRIREELFGTPLAIEVLLPPPLPPGPGQGPSVVQRTA